MAGGAKLRYGRKTEYVTFTPVIALYVIQHIYMIFENVICYGFAICALPKRHSVGVIVPVEVGVAAVEELIHFFYVAAFCGIAAAFHIGAEAVHGMVVFTDNRRHSGLAHKVCVTGGVDEHFCRVEAASAFIFNNNAAAVLILHNCMRHQGIIHDGYALVFYILAQGEHKYRSGKACQISRSVGSRSTVFPTFRNGIETVFYRKLKKLLGHTLDDLSSPTVAHGNK